MRKFDKVGTALKEIFKGRASFESDELMQYSHDVGALPRLVNRIIKTMPDAVVQPTSKEELISLAKLASRKNIPLIPRGAGSGGYGGAVPVKGGIVVDLRRMNRILYIDEVRAEVTVEPGVVWWNLERELSKNGLSLRCYPTSALSATVGGWVAQGGCGIGSFEYGSIGDNVSSVEIVTPKGEVIESADLDVVADCEGITGFITKVTLKVRKHEEIVPLAAHFKDEKSMVKALQDIKELKIWSVTLQSPESAKFKNEIEQKKSLPEDKYTVLLALHKSGYEKDGERIRKAIEENGGTAGSEVLARREWGERFYPMRAKRLGPTVIPGEVIVPVDRLDGFLGELRKEHNAKCTAIEGTMANRNECSVLVLVLDDETRADFPFGWISSLIVLKKAKKYGGRTYSVGMYLSGEVKRVFGRERLRKIKRFKKHADRKKVMNPGKVFSPRVRSFPLMKFGTLIRLVRPMLGAVRKIFAYNRPDGKELYRTSRKISNLGLDKGDAWEIYSCAQCGYCTSFCPVFGECFEESSTQRGRMFYLKKYFEDNKMELMRADKFFLCTTCGRCADVCQTDLPLVELGEKIRAGFVANGLALEKHAALAKNVAQTQNPYGEPKEKRSPGGAVRQEKSDVGYFAGCTADYRMQNLSANSVKIMDALGIKFVYLNADCCSSPLLRTGQREIAEKLILQNIDAINRAGIRTLVTSCAGCFLTISKDWAEIAKKHGSRMNFKPKHMSVFLYEILKERKPALRPLGSTLTTVTYHDPCHLGRRCGIYEEPRELLKMIPGVKLVEMEENRADTVCCGAGGGVRAAFPELANALAEKRLMDAKKSGADAVVSCCPFCEMSFNIVGKQKNIGIEVLDIVDLISQSLDGVDPNLDGFVLRTKSLVVGVGSNPSASHRELQEGK